MHSWRYSSLVPKKADPLRNVQCPLVIFLFLFITGYKKVKKKMLSVGCVTSYNSEKHQIVKSTN